MQADHLELPEDLSSAIECHLKNCDFGPEKRKSPRVATDDPAVLTVLKPEQPSRLKIRIVDASKEGLRLLVPRELMRGMIVQVHVHGFFILAEVRYCIAAGEGFHAGVQIQDVFRVAG